MSETANPSTFSSADVTFMERALAVSDGARPISPPNPNVGCVLVKDGRIIGEGHTQAVGGPHAEVMALRDALRRNESTEGATAYVTLEPCSHTGRTPPCCDALLRAGITRVVAALTDPNPLVAGQGLARLKAAGVEVASGLLAHEAEARMAGFLKRMREGTPYVRLKAAATLDGRTAFPNGESVWITGDAAREDGRRFRAISGAIVTGIGTVLADDPQMTVRDAECPREPLRVVIDPRWETPVGAKILAHPSPVLIVGTTPQTPQEDARQAALAALPNVSVWVLDKAGARRHVDLQQFLIKLAQDYSVNDVHLEAGERLNGAFLSDDLVDEIVLYQAPCFFGAGKGIATIPLPASPGAATRWRLVSTTTFDHDLRILLRRN